MSSAQSINYPLTYNTICPIGSLPDPNAYGAPGGAGYTPGATTAYFGSNGMGTIPGSGASLQVEVGTTPASGTNPGNYGQILRVNILFSGTGYQLGQPIYFTGPTGAGATAYVSGVMGTNESGTYLGGVTQISLPPNGIANQILGMITGSGYASYTVTAPGTRISIPNNGAVGAFNDQVSGYYTESSMYQSQISNIIACLNQISAADAGGSGSDIVKGFGPLPAGVTCWYTYSIATSVTGTAYNKYFTLPITYTTTSSGTAGTQYTATMNVYQYLNQYASITLNTAQSGTQAQSANIQQINSGLSPRQSNLGTANSFLQSAVSTLQSQISQFQQIVSQFYSAVQGAAGNIR